MPKEDQWFAGKDAVLDNAAVRFHVEPGTRRLPRRSRNIRILEIGIMF
jgi:hypothetical protein